MRNSREAEKIRCFTVGRGNLSSAERFGSKKR